jgi:chitin disaccharide deacetylase
MTLRLIVNADDFGAAAHIDAAIIDAHRHGIVTSASMLAVGPCFDEVVRLARDNPNLGIGVHLALTDFAPLSAPHEVSSLLDDGGSMRQGPLGFTRAYAAGQVKLSEVEREWDRQIVRVMSSGLPVTHFDGHQHLHCLPRLAELAGTLARRHGIRAIRRPRERLVAAMWRSPLRSLQQLLLNHMTGNLPQDLQMPDAFFGFADGGRLNVSALKAILRRLPAQGIAEIMCHPGGDPGDSYGAAFGYGYVQETAALVDPSILGEIARRGVELVSYKALAV